VARLRRVARPRTGYDIRPIAHRRSVPVSIHGTAGLSGGWRPTFRQPAVLYEDSWRRRGGGASPLLGRTREYSAWRRSKQEQTLRRSLEIADAKINRELARPLRADGARRTTVAGPRARGDRRGERKKPRAVAVGAAPRAWRRWRRRRFNNSDPDQLGTRATVIRR
jgi:hypothetical protein